MYSDTYCSKSYTTFAKENGVQSALESHLDISIIMTCYNERDFIIDSIQTAVNALNKAGVTFEVIIIDDISKDDSVELIKKYIDSHPELFIHLHVNAKNRGLANNYIDGAFLGAGKYYRLLCGDDSVSEDSFVNLLGYLGQADLLVPYQNQAEVKGKAQHRKLFSKAYTFLINFISGYSIKYYNGMPILRRYDVMRYAPISHGFGFQADLITRVMDTGCTFLQVCDWGTVDRKGGDSTALSFRNLLSAAHSMLEIVFRRNIWLCSR